MNFLYFLESIRVPGLNEFMLLITQLGDETVFLAAAIIAFWCVDKRMSSPAGQAVLCPAAASAA